MFAIFYNSLGRHVFSIELGAADAYGNPGVLA
jgi:hypothetical protein